MRIGRTLPPAAAPLFPVDLLYGLGGALFPDRALRRLEKEIKDRFRVGHCFFVSSGTAALSIILQALHEMHPDRNEVVIPAYDCFSVPSAIVNAGLKVRICDINPRTLDFETQSLDTLLANSDKLLCIVPTHFFGIPADVCGLRDRLRGSGVMIVEDAAQAMGCTISGKHLGTQGDAGFFSLSRGKAITAVEGGIIVTDNPLLSWEIERLVSRLRPYSATEQMKILIMAGFLWIFIHPLFFWLPKLFPFVNFGETVFHPDFSLRRMSGVQAGLLKGWEKKLKDLSCKRMKVSAAWNASRAIGLNCSRFQSPATESAAMIRYPVLIEDETTREKLLLLSAMHGLGITRMYPRPVTAISDLQFAESEKTVPGALVCAESLFTLPNHGFVTTTDMRRIDTYISSLP